MMKERGFTLLEMVVAIAIFAILSSMVSVVYISSVQNQDKAKVALQRLGEVQLAFVVIGRSLEQISNRGIRDNYGDLQPAIVSQSGLDSAIEFTQTGRVPLGFPGANLSRVGFGIKEENLYRYLWPVLDRAQDTTPVESLLLEGVKGMELRYLDAKAVWHNDWPPGLDDELAKSFPRAVELTLEIIDWGKVSRIFLLPEYEAS